MSYSRYSVERAVTPKNEKFNILLAFTFRWKPLKDQRFEDFESAQKYCLTQQDHLYDYRVKDIYNGEVLFSTKVF